MALVHPHGIPLPWRLPAALQMIRDSMRTLQTMAFVIAFAVPHAVVAQTQPPANLPAGSEAPKLSYESAFEDYRPYEDIPVADWRRVNDTVRDAVAKGGGGDGRHGTSGSSGSAGATAGKEAAPGAAAQPKMGHEMTGGRGSHGGHQ